MGTHAASTFEIDSWDEEPYDEREGAKLTRTRQFLQRIIAAGRL